MIFDKYGYETLDEMTRQAESCYNDDNGIVDDYYDGYDPDGYGKICEKNNKGEN